MTVSLLADSPAEIKLMKKGDGYVLASVLNQLTNKCILPFLNVSTCNIDLMIMKLTCVSSGSSGEEVRLSERRLQEQDIENPQAAPPEDTHSSQQRSAAASFNHSDSSDAEQEQDFVSSVVSQRPGPRVHWGDLPKRTDEDEKGGGGMMQRREKQNGDEEDMQHQESQNAEKGGKIRGDENRRKSFACETEKPKQLHTINANQPSGEQALKEERGCVEEATAKMNLCSLSEPVVATLSQSDHTTPVTSPPFIESNPAIETTTTPSSTQTPGLNITQVGMSRRGAAGLRDLLKNHSAEAKPNSIRLNLLQCLRRTLKEWSTDETLRFLYGADHSLHSPFADAKEEKKEEVEELDEDDLEDEASEEDGGGVDAGLQQRPSAAAPDFQTLRKETQQLELRVREFYKGTWLLPEEVDELNGNKVRERRKERRGGLRMEALVVRVSSHMGALYKTNVMLSQICSK